MLQSWGLEIRALSANAKGEQRLQVKQALSREKLLRDRKEQGCPPPPRVEAKRES